MQMMKFVNSSHQNFLSDEIIMKIQETWFLVSVLFPGMTALMLASVSGHMGTIRELIDANADFDPEPSIATCQVTPLMIAAQHGNDALVRLYLDKGVSANKATPSTSKNPDMCACMLVCITV